MVRKALKQVCKIFILVVLTAAQNLTITAINFKQPLSEVLPIDADLHVGTLENGFRYYIRKNSRPEKHAIVQLYVNAGSINELENQQGLAHFCEHAVFKGSESFPDEKSLNNYFASRGIQFGPDLNAFTGFTSTNYILTIPTDDEELLEKTFTTMADFAGGALLSDAAINAERSIILDELQMRSSATMRNLKAIVPFLLTDSSYADRFISGKTEIISNEPAQSVRDFYHAWYVPGNMALIAIGDFEPTIIKQLIEKNFGSLAHRTTASTTHINKKPKIEAGKYLFFTDPENKDSDFEIYFKTKSLHLKNIQDLRTALITNLVTTILQQRMNAHTSQPGAATNGLSCNILNKFFDCYDLSYAIATASLKDGKSLEGAIELVNIIKQFIDHGIHQNELDWAKTAIAAQNANMLANLKTLPSNFYLKRYSIHVKDTEHPLIADIGETLRLEATLLETVSQEDANERIQEIFDFKNAIYSSSLNLDTYKKINEKDGEAAFIQKVKDESEKATLPYQAQDKAELPRSLSQDEGSATINDMLEIDAKKITLENGISVYFKRTNYSEDNVSICAMALGGFDSVQENPVACRMACNAIASTGFGGLKPFQLAQALSEKPQLNLNVNIDLHNRFLTGTCRKDDLLLCFNLIIAKMLHPNADSELFALYTQATKESIKGKQNSPMALFIEKTHSTILSHPTLFKPLTSEMVDETSLEDVVTLYQKAFNNIGEFTFAISGNIALEELMPVLNGTIGKMPASQSSAWNAQSINVKFPENPAQVEFEQKTKDQTFVFATFPFNLTHTIENSQLVKLYAQIIQKRMIEVLRMDGGKAYTPIVSITTLNDLFLNSFDDSCRLQIQFSCSKENVSSAIEVIIAELKKISLNGFESEEIEQVKKIAQNQTIQAFKNNIMWNLYILDRHFRLNGECESVEQLCKKIDSINQDELNEFAKNLINPHNHFIHSILSSE